jgi:hypothetical protein
LTIGGWKSLDGQRDRLPIEALSNETVKSFTDCGRVRGCNHLL